MGAGMLWVSLSCAQHIKTARTSALILLHTHPQEAVLKDWGYLKVYLDQFRSVFPEVVEKLERRESTRRKIMVNTLRPLASVWCRTSRDRIILHMQDPKATVQSISRRCDELSKEEWLTWHWESVKNNFIGKDKSMPLC